MKNLPIILGAVAIGVITSAVAESFLAPALKNLLVDPHYPVVVHWIGNVISIVVAIFVYNRLETGRPKR